MNTPSPSLTQHPTLERLGSAPWWKHLVQDGVELPSEPGGRVCAIIFIVIVGIWANDCYLPNFQRTGLLQTWIGEKPRLRQDDVDIF